MIAELARRLRHIVAVGDKQAAVAIGAEVLGGEEGEGAGVAQATGLVPGAVAVAAVAGTNGLGAILQHHQVVFVRQGEERLHLRRAAEQVHGQDGLGPFGDGRLDQGHIDVEGLPVDVHEDRCGPDCADGLRRGEKGEGAGYDLVAGTDPQGTQADDQGIRAGVEADGVFDAQVLCR